MTEAEAKRLGCPMLKRTCLGSGCMAWKWGIPHDPRERHLYSKRTGNRVTAAFGDDAEWRLENPDDPIPEQHGSCSALRF